MFARLVTFENVDAAVADEALRWMQENAVPAARELEGFRAAVALRSRQSGSMAVITIFDREEHVRAAEPSFEETASRMPGDLKDAVEGTLRSAEVMEVVIREGF